MILVHGSNLALKESHTIKYTDERSRQMLTEIRAAYDVWKAANEKLRGPWLNSTAEDISIIEQRVKLFSEYKDFIDQQKYAEQFDSRSNLHSSVLEEFMYWLFRDLVSEFGERVLIGKSHTFKDMFFVTGNYKSLLRKPGVRIEKKDHDFVIGVSVQARLRTILRTAVPSMVSIDSGQAALPFDTSTQVEGELDIEVVDESSAGADEVHVFDVPAVVIECKTYLDKTMLEGSSRAAEDLKARNPNGLYMVVCERLKLTRDTNLRKYKLDQIYVLRKQRNTDREYRYASTYVANPIFVDVVWHLFEFVRNHLTTDWSGGIDDGLNRGYLI